MTALSPTRRAHIRTEAESLLDRCGAGRIDFAVLMRICRDEGIELLDADLRDITGALRRTGERWRLYLNRGDAPARRLFTLAHALGHYVLHARSGRSFVESRFTRSESAGVDEGAAEREANEFAACLVMPAVMIHAQLASHPPTEGQILDLAGRFGVSPLAVAHRLSTLGYTVPPASARTPSRRVRWPSPPAGGWISPAHPGVR